MKKHRTRTASYMVCVLTAAMAAGMTALAYGQDCGGCSAEKSLILPHKSDANALQAGEHLAASKSPACGYITQSKVGFRFSDYQVIEKRANTFKNNHQDGTVLDVDSQGNLLVAWGSRKQELGTYGVFAQRFDALGRPLGTEIRVNQFAPNSQVNPAVAYGPDDQAWVSWMSFNQDGYTEGDSKIIHAGTGEIYARRFGVDSDGSFGALGDEFRVNQTIRGHQELASVSVNKDGSAFFTWTSNVDEKTIVMGRLFHADGTAASDEIRLSDCCPVSFMDSLASSVALSDGGFVTVWARATVDGDPLGLYGRMINANGVAIGDEILISEKRGDIEPSIDADSSGRFVVAWMSQREDTKYDVHARRFGSDGEALGGVIVVSDDDVQWKNGASVAVAPDGRFAVSWNEFSPIGDSDALKMKAKEPARVLAKVYSVDGTLQTGEAFQVNRFNDGQQRLVVASNARRMAWTGLDQLAFAWEGKTEGDGSAAAFTLLAPKGLYIPAAPAVAAVAAGRDLAMDGITGLRMLIPPIYDPNAISPENPVHVMPAGSDFGFVGSEFTHFFPPDPEIAAGMNHLVVILNGGINFYTKDGTLTFTQTLLDFWKEVGARFAVSDPVTAYDHWSGRFVVAAFEREGSSDFIELAVSDDGDPNGIWYKYRVNVDALDEFIDFPNLGIGPNEIYIASDFFGDNAQRKTNKGNHVVIFDKGPLLVGDPVSFVEFETSPNLRSLGSTNDYDDDGVQYFITAFSGSNTKITIDAVRDPFGVLLYDTTDVTVPKIFPVTDAPQKGTSRRLDALDERIKNGVVRNGHLWTVHTVGDATKSVPHVRWYDIDLRGWPVSGQQPMVNQTGTFDFGSGQANWMADIGVDDLGDAVIAYSRSSSNDFAYVARSARLAGDPPNTFGPSTKMVDGLGTDTSKRWGDFAGVDEDPSVPGTFWTHNEFTGSLNWRTWVGEVVTGSSGMQLSVDQVVHGQVTNMSVSGATAGTSVYFVYSVKGLGSTVIPQLNVTLDLLQPQLIGSNVADGSGNATLAVPIPVNAPIGKSVWFQAAALGEKSNYLEFMIQ